MANDITELRDILFDTIRQLKDKENPLPLDRAKMVGELSQVVINSAKVELEHARLTKTAGTGFIPLSAPLLAESHRDSKPDPSTPVATATGTKTVQQIGGATVTSHRMR